MAYLNVRERVIETKIAYVGAELSGKATNFEHLCKDTRDGRASALEHEPVDGGALLSFEWRPHRMAQFNDCDVLVRLTATHGAVSDEQMKAVLSDADGVVFVVDSDPVAQDKNRRTLESLKGLLAGDTREARPVVVQVNKRDLPNAVPSTELVGSLDVQAWPHVAASAALGEGVVETLLKAVEDVIESVKQSSPDDDWEPVEPPPTARGGKSTDGHPLLAALRQILREAVAERVDALEARLLDRVELKLATWSTTLVDKWTKVLSNATTSLHQPLATLSKESASIRNALASAGSETAALQKSMTTLSAEGTALQKAVAALSTDAAATKKSLAALTAELRAMRGGFAEGTNGASALHQRALEEAAQNRDALQALNGRFDELIAELKKPKKSWFG